MSKYLSPNHEEDVIEPSLPIIDPHHHLWVHTGQRYLLDEFVADLQTGHNIIATVYSECNAMYRRNGPEASRSVGEAEFVAGVAAMSDSGYFGPTRICAGFVGAANFLLGAEVDRILEELAVASGGRLRGIRGAAAWDADPAINTGTRPFAPRGLLLDPRFQAGVERLMKYELVYDGWQLHPQLPELCQLADAMPELPVVVNHCGGLIAFGSYATPDTFGIWRQNIAEVARRPNTFMKLGGLAKRFAGPVSNNEGSPTAQELSNLWRPYMESCIELFGASRCMFESNFPPDNTAASYRTIWNAFKLMVASYSAAEKNQLFHGTAARVYRIPTEVI